jgi:tRNA-Thr(GGU) m(6)t(6)A37 methyltransferase TsaA
MTIQFESIGLIRTPFSQREGTPIQAKGARGAKGRIILKEALAPGLKDLDGFSHLMLIYQFHLSTGYELETTPFLDTVPRGVFATRAPRRPNPIGLSVVRLTRIEGHVLHIEGVDMLDETPLLDIKPYLAEFDVFEPEREGWLETKARYLHHVRSDGRFD